MNISSPDKHSIMPIPMLHGKQGAAAAVSFFVVLASRL
jgi:hypothetical protein